jgi:hypothetical protein
MYKTIKSNDAINFLRQTYNTQDNMVAFFRIWITNSTQVTTYTSMYCHVTHPFVPRVHISISLALRVPPTQRQPFDQLSYKKI